MKVIVNKGRTVHRAVKPGEQLTDERSKPPVLKAYGPTHLIDVSDEEEAQFLISRGFVQKYVPPKIDEPAPSTDDKKQPAK